MINNRRYQKVINNNRKRLIIETTRNRIWDTKFDENDFFVWMEKHGSASIVVGAQIILYLEHKYRDFLIGIRGESVRNIKYTLSKSFMDRYKCIDETLKYNI